MSNPSQWNHTHHVSFFISTPYYTKIIITSQRSSKKKQDQHPLFFASLVRSKHYYRDCQCQWRARNTIILLIPCRAHSIIHFLGKLHEQGYFDYGMVQLYRKHFDKESSNKILYFVTCMAELSTLKMAQLYEAIFSTFNIPNYFITIPKSAKLLYLFASSSTDIVNVAEGFKHRNEGQKERSIQTIEVPFVMGILAAPPKATPPEIRPY